MRHFWGKEESIMPDSVWDAEVQSTLDQAYEPGVKLVYVGNRNVEVLTPFPSPIDWRDTWIYFMMVDRFNNPAAPPRHQPWDQPWGDYQGGTFAGIKQQLDYLQELGVGALWLSPLLKNCQYSPSYHGYGFQNFMAIEPRFSSDPEQARNDPQFLESELRELVDEAHARNIYVIFDIVLHHVGDVFAYSDFGSVAPWNNQPSPLLWRDEDGNPNPAWSEAPPNPPLEAAVWPRELQGNRFFKRQGNAFVDSQIIPEGDFYSFKARVTEEQIAHFIGRNALAEGEPIGVDAALD